MQATRLRTKNKARYIRVQVDGLGWRYQARCHAGLMAFNLSPDKPAIGIALSGSNLTNAALGYTNYTGGYLNIYSGSRTIEAYDAGGGNTFTASDYNFEQNKYYSLFIVGKDSAYRNIVVNDQLDSLSANSGKAFIRYVNAVPDSSRPTRL